MVVVADTSPINYLILIGELEALLRALGPIIIPDSVFGGLLCPPAPAICQTWRERLPSWLEVRTPTQTVASRLNKLGRGERDAITLAMELNVERLVMDDKRGRVEASRLNLPVIGTVAVLQSAARLGLLNFKDAMTRLRGTNFRISDELFDRLLRDKP